MTTPPLPLTVLTLSVEENRPIGTLYLLPTATDRDFGRNGIDRYELIQDSRDGGASCGGLQMDRPMGTVVTEGEGQKQGQDLPAVAACLNFKLPTTPEGQNSPS